LVNPKPQLFGRGAERISQLPESKILLVVALAIDETTCFFARETRLRERCGSSAYSHAQCTVCGDQVLGRLGFLRLHDMRGKLQHVFGHFFIQDLIEVIFLFSYFIGIAQRRPRSS